MNWIEFKIFLQFSAIALHLQIFVDIVLKKYSTIYPFILMLFSALFAKAPPSSSSVFFFFFFFFGLLYIKYGTHFDGLMLPLEFCFLLLPFPHLFYTYPIHWILSLHNIFFLEKAFASYIFTMEIQDENKLT